MDVIQRVFSLRRSSEHAVVSEAGRTESQRRLHVEDAIEGWLVERIHAARAEADRATLIVLSGNAGDGKSDLLDRLEDKIDLDACELIRDATQSDDPNEDQIARLAAFFRPFADEPEAGKPVHLIAMNTGMAISFFDRAQSRAGQLGSFATLEAVTKRELGLGGGGPQAEPPWDYEVINLDRRDLLHPEFFEPMLGRLNPDNEDGLFGDTGNPCAHCALAEACFVRTNLELLRDQRVRDGLRAVLRGATMEQGVHFSPRNLWDALSWFIGGDSDFFGTGAPSCAALEKVVSEQEPAELLPRLHRRLLWHSVFQHPEGGQRLRGSAIDALRSVDPLPRTGRHCHEQEALIYAGPASEAQQLRDIADDYCGGEGATLKHLAEAMSTQDASVFEAVRGDLLRGVARRAMILQTPGFLYQELIDEDLRDFQEILDAYAAWVPSARPDPALINFTTTTLRDGIARVFGMRVGQDVYFRLNAFAPSTNYPAYAHVDMGKINPRHDDDIVRGRTWIDKLRYRPATILVEVGSDAGTSRFHVDLPLFRLLRRVAAGYSASSFDLEAFYALRFACERLGDSGTAGDDVVLSETATGKRFRARLTNVLGQDTFSFEAIT